MTTYIVYDTADGRAVSIGTTLPDEGLPAGLASYVVDPADIDPLRRGWLRWDPATLGLVDSGKQAKDQADDVDRAQLVAAYVTLRDHPTSTTAERWQMVDLMRTIMLAMLRREYRDEVT